MRVEHTVFKRFLDYFFQVNLLDFWWLKFYSAKIAVDSYDNDNNNDKATISLGEKQCDVLKKENRNTYTQTIKRRREEEKKNTFYKINSRISPKNTSENTSI